MPPDDKLDLELENEEDEEGEKEIDEPSEVKPKRAKKNAAPLDGSALVAVISEFSKRLAKLERVLKEDKAPPPPSSPIGNDESTWGKVKTWLNS